MNERGHKLEIKTDRNYGIDALRIISMFMVVVLHIFGHGGVLEATEIFSTQYETAWFLEIASYCAVNCYALISGYVGVFARHRYSSLALLWIRVVFYSFGIACFFKLFIPEIASFNIKGSLIFCIPVLTNRYWYFTSYVLLFLFIPVLNAALHHLSKNTLRAILVILVLCISVVFPLFSTIGISGDIWGLGNGYSSLWLMIVYLLGGYIRKYGIFKTVKSIWFLITYLGCVILTWLSMWVIQVITINLFGSAKCDGMWRSYLSITILVAAIALVLLFERINPPRALKRAISFFAPLAFSVYLIHEHPLIRENFITNRFVWIADLNPVFLVLTVLGVAFCIFTVCMMIDVVRESIFNLLKLKQRLNYLEDKIRIRLIKKDEC